MSKCEDCKNENCWPVCNNCENYREYELKFSNVNPDMKTLAEIREEAYKQGKADAIVEFANFLCKRIPYAELSMPQLVEEFKKEQAND